MNTSIQFAIFSRSERMSAKHLVPNTFLIASINKNIKKNNYKYYLIILCNPELDLPDVSDHDNDAEDNDNARPSQQELGPESSGSKEMCGMAVVFYIVCCLRHSHHHWNHHHHHQHHHHNHIVIVIINNNIINIIIIKFLIIVLIIITIMSLSSS